MTWEIKRKIAQVEIFEQEFSRAIHLKLTVRVLFLCSEVLLPAKKCY